jgi:hypothetical protein
MNPEHSFSHAANRQWADGICDIRKYALPSAGIRGAKYISSGKHIALM